MTREELLEDIKDGEEALRQAKDDCKEAEKWLITCLKNVHESYLKLLEHDKENV